MSRTRRRSGTKTKVVPPGFNDGRKSPKYKYPQRSKYHRRKVAAAVLAVYALLGALALSGCGRAVDATGASRDAAARLADPPEVVLVACAQETLSCFNGRATLTLVPEGVSATGPAASQDLPDPAFQNRWRQVLGGVAGELLRTRSGRRSGVTICGGASGGRFWQEEVGSWRAEITPSDPAVAAQLRELEGARQCGGDFWPQEVLVGATNAGGVEAVFEERRP